MKFKASLRAWKRMRMWLSLSLLIKENIMTFKILQHGKFIEVTEERFNNFVARRDAITWSEADTWFAK
jgi:hypothetical protein